MSSTKRGSIRHLNDNYPTPSWCVYRLFESLWFDTSDDYKWIEPCAGDGNIIKSTNSVFDRIHWSAAEIRECCARSLEKITKYSYIGDFLQFPLYKNETYYDVAITNPPFSIAMDIVKKCRNIAYNVIILQRLNFIGSLKRYDFFKSDMPDVYVLPNRPSFRKDKKTDSIEYAWFHWGPQPEAYGTIKILKTTSAKERNNK